MQLAMFDYVCLLFNRLGLAWEEKHESSTSADDWVSASHSVASRENILDYSNFKLTNQVARNAGSIFHSHLVSGIYSWPLAPSTGIYWHACC